MNKVVLLVSAMMATLMITMVGYASKEGLSPRPVEAATATQSFTSAADAGLSELAPSSNNGSATSLKVDGDDPDPGGGDLYAALRWDLSQVPAGATVSSATITLNITNPSPQTYGAYELKKSGNEGQLTWNQAATGSPWATAGAKGTTDRGAQIASVTPTAVAPYTFTIPASVAQGWLNTPSSNNGILLAHTTNYDGFVFDTKEGAQPPKFTLNYTTSGGGADTTPPDTSIDSGPSGTFTNPSASFTFSSSEAGSTFECKLDGGSFGSCTSPKSYTSLSDGSHTFSVRAKDSAGNVDSTPAARTWTVSTAPVSQTVTLNSVADAGLSELAPNTNNGAATTLKVDGDDPDPGGGDLYAALRWDLSQIPAGATVSSATVTLNISNHSNDTGTPQTYGAYELKKAWNEGQLSWNQAATGAPWTTAGAKGTT